MNVTLLVRLSYVNEPAIVPPGPEAINDVLLIVAGSIASLKLTVMIVLTGTFAMPFAGLLTEIVGGVVSRPVPVRLVASDGVSGSFEFTTNVAVTAVATDGVYVTLTVQLPPAVIVAVALLHGALPPLRSKAKSALPVVVIFVTTRSARPAFMIVNVCDVAMPPIA